MNTFVKIVFLFCACSAIVESRPSRTRKSRCSSSNHQNAITPEELGNAILTLPKHEQLEAHSLIQALIQRAEPDSKFHTFLKGIPLQSVTDDDDVELDSVSPPEPAGSVNNALDYQNNSASHENGQSESLSAKTDIETEVRNEA